MDILNNDNFDSSIKTGIVLVDFFAEWCGPCHALSPILEEMSTRYTGKINFFKVDVDQAPQVAAKYQVMSIPTTIIFKDGEIAGTIIGAQPASRYSDQLDKLIS